MWWEQDTRQPCVHQYPAIISYLDYEPWIRPVTLREQLLAARRRRGLSISAAATLIGVDEGTFGRWENGSWKPQPRSYATIKSFLTGDLDSGE